jgi:hypothetical protein
MKEFCSVESDGGWNRWRNMNFWFRKWVPDAISQGRWWIVNPVLQLASF